MTRNFRDSVLVQRIRERGPKISLQDIVDFEKEVQLELPSDYREFLLEYNGGTSYESDFIEFPTPEHPHRDGISYIELAGLKYPYDERGIDIRYMLNNYGDELPKNMIPVGASEGDYFLITPREGGKVYFWSKEFKHSNDADERSSILFADSFTEFTLGCHYISEEEMESLALETEEPFLSIELRRHEQLLQHLNDGFWLAERNSQDQTALYVACRDLNYEASEELLRRGADPDDGDHGRQYPPLYAAAAAGASELAKLLLSYGASPFMDAERKRPILDELRLPPEERMRKVFEEASRQT